MKKLWIFFLKNLQFSVPVMLNQKLLKWEWAEIFFRKMKSNIIKAGLFMIENYMDATKSAP